VPYGAGAICPFADVNRFVAKDNLGCIKILNPRLGLGASQEKLTRLDIITEHINLEHTFIWLGVFSQPLGQGSLELLPSSITDWNFTFDAKRNRCGLRAHGSGEDSHKNQHAECVNNKCDLPAHDSKLPASRIMSITPSCHPCRHAVTVSSEQPSAGVASPGSALVGVSQLGRAMTPG
jgi:hypothetical protein